VKRARIFSAKLFYLGYERNRSRRLRHFSTRYESHHFPFACGASTTPRGGKGYLTARKQAFDLIAKFQELSITI
jgi:hypothetical protein